MSNRLINKIYEPIDNVQDFIGEDLFNKKETFSQNIFISIIHLLLLPKTSKTIKLYFVVLLWQQILKIKLIFTLSS